MPRTKTYMCLFGLLALPSMGTPAGLAQTPVNSSVEVALTFSTQRSLEANTTENFWATGGAVEAGVNAFHGFGIAANVAGVHTSSIGSTGTPLTLITETFGPRYRWHDGHRLSLYGEGLLGEANAYGSLFPSASGAQTDAVSIATRFAGGFDVTLNRHLRIRVIDAAWLRTQLPNSGSNVQNNLLLGAGFVLRTER